MRFVFPILAVVLQTSPAAAEKTFDCQMIKTCEMGQACRKSNETVQFIEYSADEGVIVIDGVEYAMSLNRDARLLMWKVEDVVYSAFVKETGLDFIVLRIDASKKGKVDTAELIEMTCTRS